MGFTGVSYFTLVISLVFRNRNLVATSRPASETEKKRIEASGGYLEVRCPKDRVVGPLLNGLNGL